MRPIDLAAWHVPPRLGVPELIDLPETPFEDVLTAMRDVRRVNALLGTYPLMFRALDRLASWPAGRPLRVLDVATGLADVPRALVGWAARRRKAVAVTGLDLNPRILEMAREATRGCPEIELVTGDALSLPFEAASFDWALCHLALHHFPPETHAAFFAELDRVVRPGGGILVGDLVRSRLNHALACGFLGVVASRLGARDGRVSVLNALSARELDALVATTGLGYLRRVRPAPPAQFLLGGVKPE